MQSDRDVLTLIRSDTWMMNVLEAVRRQLASAEAQGERLGKEHRMLSEALADSSKPKAPSLWSKRVCSPVGELQEESRRN